MGFIRMAVHPVAQATDLGGKELPEGGGVAGEADIFLAGEGLEKPADGGALETPGAFGMGEIVGTDAAVIDELDGELVDACAKGFLKVADEGLVVVFSAMEDAEVGVESGATQEDIEAGKKAGVEEVEEGVPAVGLGAWHAARGEKGVVADPAVDHGENGPGGAPLESEQ